MSISSTTNKVNYTGNGSTDTYTYPFKIFSETDLIVTEKLISTGAETPLVLNTDYTVTDVGETSGGTIVLDAGNLPSTKKIYIRRKLTLVQSADIRNLGVYYASSHEDVFDKLIMMLQQIQFLCDQSIKLPETITSGFNTTLPNDVATANRSLVINEDGDGFELGPTTEEISNAQTYAETALSAVEDATTLVWGTTASPKSIISGTGIVGGTLISTTRATQLIFVEGSSAGENDISVNPQIEAHTVVGAKLRIVGANTSNFILLENGNGLYLNGPWRSAENDGSGTYYNNCIELFWNGSVWHEQSRLI